jgi:CubicO group peptidase (beta-lactamase class C family)
MYSRIRTFFASCGLLFLSFYSVAQADQAELGIKAIMDQSKVMGLSVAVVKNNKVIYTHSFGYKPKNPLQTIVCLELLPSQNLSQLLL